MSGCPRSLAFGDLGTDAAALFVLPRHLVIGVRTGMDRDPAGNSATRTSALCGEERLGPESSQVPKGEGPGAPDSRVYLPAVSPSAFIALSRVWASR